MATEVPEHFSEPQEGVLVNYNWTDIASGTGYVTFFGTENLDNSQTLIPAANLDADELSTQAVCDGGAALRFEKDFDVAFNLPQSIKGDLLVNISYVAVGSAAGEATVYTKVKIIHYDGSTETIIGAQQTTTSQVSAHPVQEGRRSLIKFAVDKHFKKGEILRVNVEAWGGGSANNQVVVLHDPANTDLGYNRDVTDGVLPSTLRVDVPFQITI